MTVVMQNRMVRKEHHMQPFHMLFATCCDFTASALPSVGRPPLEASFFIAERRTHFPPFFPMPHLAVAVMMQRVRARMIQDRKEEIEGVAKMIYKERQAQGSHNQQQTDGFADWVEAENRVIRSTFERQTGCTLSLTASMLVSLLQLSVKIQ